MTEHTDTDTDNKDREPFVVTRMTDDELREFVRAYLSGKLFTLAHISDHDAEMASKIFLPFLLGGFADMHPEALDQIGMVYEYLDQASPVSINGYPIFLSARFMHQDDWKRAAAAINREMDHQDSIEV